MSKEKGPRYKGRADEELTFEEWKANTENEEYSVLCQFRNDKVKLSLEWLGTTSDSRAPFEYWDIYELNVWNWLIDGAELEGGRWVLDPRSRRYWDEAAAVKAYERFLVDYTDCEYVPLEDGSMAFKEVGNDLTPPDPNMPSGADNNPFIGSW